MRVLGGASKYLSRLATVIARASRDPWVSSLAERYGYLPYMVARYVEILGRNEARELLESNEEPMPETIRCNDYLIDCGLLRERLEAKGFVLEKVPFLPHGYEVLETPSKGTVGSTHEYLMGYYYIQDPASMSVVYALDPRPGETVVDMAAAPGGKATQILQLTGDSALLVAIEKNPRRARALRSNLNRMRFSSYIIVIGDSTRDTIPVGAPDRVLVDAPSTGEGIIRKDPRRKRSRTLEDLEEIHEVQYRMLSRALSLVRPGGVVVYSACTLAPEEGELVISRILGERGDVEVEPSGLPGSPGITEYFGLELDPRVAGCTRFWPQRHGTEGFFICRLRRAASNGYS